MGLNAFYWLQIFTLDSVVVNTQNLISSHGGFLTNAMRKDGERSGSVVECLTRDRKSAGSSLTGVTALWSLSKTHLS